MADTKRRVRTGSHYYEGAQLLLRVFMAQLEYYDVRPLPSKHNLRLLVDNEADADGLSCYWREFFTNPKLNNEQVMAACRSAVESRTEVERCCKPCAHLRAIYCGNTPLCTRGSIEVRSRRGIPLEDWMLGFGSTKWAGPVVFDIESWQFYLIIEEGEVQANPSQVLWFYLEEPEHTLEYSHEACIRTTRSSIRRHPFGNRRRHSYKQILRLFLAKCQGLPENSPWHALCGVGTDRQIIEPLMEAVVKCTGGLEWRDVLVAHLRRNRIEDIHAVSEFDLMSIRRGPNVEGQFKMEGTESPYEYFLSYCCGDQIDVSFVQDWKSTHTVKQIVEIAHEHLNVTWDGYFDENSTEFENAILATLAAAALRAEVALKVTRRAASIILAIFADYEWYFLRFLTGKQHADRILQIALARA